jgi:hypothetical protein
VFHINNSILLSILPALFCPPKPAHQQANRTGSAKLFQPARFFASPDYLVVKTNGFQAFLAVCFFTSQKVKVCRTVAPSRKNYSAESFDGEKIFVPKTFPRQNTLHIFSVS